MFELKVNEGKVVRLKWGTYAMKYFCDQRNISPADFLELLSTASFDIGVICLLIQSGMAAAGDTPEDERTVCDWIDDCGGIFKLTGPLVDYAGYIVDNTVANITPLPGDKVEEDIKKKVTP